MNAAITTIHANGLELRVQVKGEGRPVVLLHGFPDSSWLWRKVSPDLVAHGHRVIAPDQRGFGESSAPVGKQHYKLSLLAGDVLAIMDALKVEQAHVVGHDWGSAVAWKLAGDSPDRFISLTLLSFGNPRAYMGAGWEQWKRAWYVLLFLLPGIAERAVAANDFQRLRQAAQHHPETSRWATDLSRPGRLTAAMNWYRANAMNPGLLRNVTLPTLGVWSSQDFALAEAQMTGSKKFVNGPFRYERLDDIGHWIPLDAPAQLCELLREWFDTTNP